MDREGPGGNGGLHTPHLAYLGISVEYLEEGMYWRCTVAELNLAGVIFDVVRH